MQIYPLFKKIYNQNSNLIQKHAKTKRLICISAVEDTCRDQTKMTTSSLEVDSFRNTDVCDHSCSEFLQISISGCFCLFVYWPVGPQQGVTSLRQDYFGV